MADELIAASITPTASTEASLTIASRLLAASITPIASTSANLIFDRLLAASITPTASTIGNVKTTASLGRGLSKLYGGTALNGNLFEWNESNAWVQKAPKLSAETYIFSLAVFDGKVYGGSGLNGKLYEWNGSNAWVEKAPQFDGETLICSLVVFNGKLYGTTGPNGRLYEWNGTNAWVEVAGKLGDETYIFSSVVFNGKLYGGTYPNGKLYEWDGVDEWAEVAGQLNGQTYIYSLIVHDGKIYGGTYGGGRLFEWNGVDAWTEKAGKLGDEVTIYSLAILNEKIYGGTHPYGKLYEWNGTNAWVEKAPQSGSETRIYSLCMFNGKIYGGTYNLGKLLEWNGVNAWIERAPQLNSETYILVLIAFGATAPVAATSSVTGNLTGIQNLAGVVNAQVTSTVARLQGTQEFAAFCSGVSSTSPSVIANLTGVQKLAGSVTSASNLVGRFSFDTDFEATISSISSVTGRLAGTVVLTGFVSSASTVIGGLKGTQILVGSISSSSVIIANVGGALKLTGDVVGVSGTVVYLTGAQELIAHVIGECGVAPGTEGALTVNPRLLAGVITSNSTVSGTVNIFQYVTGGILSTSTVSGNLVGTQKLAGIVSAQFITSGWLFAKLGIQFQYYKTEGADDNYILLDSPTKKLAQTFPVTKHHSIYRVDLKLFRVGTPGTITIEIRENDGSGDEYYPSGAVLASGTYDGDSLTTDSGGGWEYISLSNIGWLEVNLAAGVDKVYGIVISCAGADSSNKVGWRYDDTSSTFSGGRWCYYDGAAWSEESGNDFMFGEWGHRPKLTGDVLSSWINTDLACSRILITYDITAPFAGGAYEHTVIDSPSYSSNAPISMEGTSHDGNMAPTYRDDFYYKIHIYETHAGDTPIDLGLILEDITQEFWIWNSYLEPSTTKTLDNIAITGALTLSDITAPKTFKIMQAEKCFANILKEGLPEYRAEATFDFGVEGTIILVITGTRVITVFWAPRNNIKEVLEWKTDILRAHEGSEQRIKMRQVPRQFFKLQFIIKTDKMNSWFDTILHTWQKRAWGIPIWTELVIHTANITAGDLTITVDTTYADFRNTSYAIVWKSETEYEVVSIATKTGSALTLSSAMQNSFTGTKFIMPLRIAYMIGKNIKNKYNSPVSAIEASFVVSDNVAITGHVSAVTYDSLEVLTVPSFMGDIHREESDGLIESVDFSTGVFKVRSDKEFNLLAQNHIFINDTKQACWEFRQFLHWMNGRQQAVLVPTFRADLVQVGTIGSGDTFFYVENIKLTSNLGVNTLRTYIGFYFSNGTLIIRKITAIDETDSTKEKITINTSLGQEVTAGSCKICFVDKCRFASDKINIDWVRSYRNECRTNLIRVT